MVLALDIGNTSLSLAAFDGETLIDHDRIPVEDVEWISHTWRSSRLARLAPYEAVLISSVRPQAEPSIVAWATDDLHAPARFAGTDFPVPLRNLTDAPDQVGMDRLLAAYAGYRRAGGAAVVVTFGTAITVNAVSKDGGFLGGGIAPGIGLSAEALSRECAQLPRVTPQRMDRIIGGSTEAAIRSALYFGFAGLVQRLISGAAAELGGSPAVFGTGGDAALLAPLLPGMEVVPQLVQEGLVKAWLAARGGA